MAWGLSNSRDFVVVAGVGQGRGRKLYRVWLSLEAGAY